MLPVRTVQSPRSRRGAQTGLEPPLHGDPAKPPPCSAKPPPLFNRSRRSLRDSPGAATAPAPPRGARAPPAGGGCEGLAPAPGQRVRGTAHPPHSPCPLQLLQKLRTSHRPPGAPGHLPALGGSAKPGSRQRSRVVYFCYGHITESSPLPWARSPGSGCWLSRATEAAVSGIELSVAPAGALGPPPLQRCPFFSLFLWQEVHLSLS